VKDVLLSTDGACIGNPGPGGWACVLRYRDHCRELSGGAPQTTNNRMELTAAIEGLKALKEPCHVTLRTDSQYLRDGVTSWIAKWKTDGWVHKVKHEGRQPVKNRDLWEELDRLQAAHKIEWEWVKGHATDVDNNRCDALAMAAARKFRKDARAIP
jgi:ribonuclease HI